MASSGRYVLNLKSLPQGKHRFDYELDDSFFEQSGSYDILGGTLAAKGEVERNGDVFNFCIALDGTVKTACDRCLDEVEIPVKEENKLVVRFGDSYQELSDDLLVVPLSEGTLDLSSLLYEYSELAIPMQRMHSDGECDPEMMNRMSDLLAIDADEATEESGMTAHDSRWDSLGKLLEQKEQFK